MQDATILMGVYNGAAHLDEQLDSFAAQQGAGWWLIASDDGSADASRAILHRFAARFAPGRVSVVDGPHCGFAANYLSMLRRLPPDPGWLAFSDQDDVWLPDRLKLGMRALEDAAGPALHASRTWVVSQDLGQRRLARGCPRPTGFAHALVQNVAAGNTILANPAAARVLVAAARRTEDVVAHDWWAYQIVTGAGGRMVFDDRPTVLYRQHGRNAIGANDGPRAKLARLRKLAAGTMAGWLDVNLAALEAAGPLLTPQSQAMVAELAALRRDPNPLARLRRARRLGLYRQTRSSTWALWLAAAAGWL